ncbi:peptidase family M41-domain-containing protein [Myxozyma melibiosi]|uniref:Peptidase family M41-domain-containing protein n=1 Tax=Myxozyma melibiosi TaxID=54550 RepID=A0ABR1F7D7_9ASCO
MSSRLLLSSVALRPALCRAITHSVSRQPIASSILPVLRPLLRPRPRPSSPLSLAPSSRLISSWAARRLSAKEEKANLQKNNPDAQADLYADLLEHGYPQFVIERYQNKSIARNKTCDAYYYEAIARTGGQPAQSLDYQSSRASAPATAVSASSAAAAASAPGFIGRAANTGDKFDPIHVVIQDGKGSLVFRYLKLLASFAFTYFANKDTSVTQPTVRFSDVHGVDEARADLEEVVDFLRDPAKFTGLGGRLPKGVLLTGPPGTGKTLLARAVAGEAGVPFFFMSGSEFDEMYVGVGAKRVRELFAAAKAKAPSIVFIDELDAIGGKRNSRDQAYVKQTLNQLLVDLDGFSQTTGVIFIAATNFPELLDPALTRPGRFDKIVNVDLPDVRGRIAILRHHMKNVIANKSVDVDAIARGTPGFSGADLQNLVNQAAIYASRQNAVAVDTQHFEWAKDKILMGAEKTTMVLTEESKRLTAYHEAGHALMAMYTPGATALYKATILPRGRALGVTFQLPEMDKYSQSKKELLAQIDVCMGGKAAEEFINGVENVTSGCSSDLRQATKVARAMVASYGMSEKVGPVELAEDWSQWSATTRELAESEIRDVLQKSEDRAQKLLRDRSVELKRLAEALVEYETLDRQDIERAVKGEKPEKPIPPKKSNQIVSKPSSAGGLLPAPAPVARDSTSSS